MEVAAMLTPAQIRPTGHTQVKTTGGRRSYYAFWHDAEGKHGKRLGSAHVKDSGRRTPRGAVVWRAADGPKPSPEHLVPKEAQALLEEILAAAPRISSKTIESAHHTLRDAAEATSPSASARRGSSGARSSATRTSTSGSIETSAKTGRWKRSTTESSCGSTSRPSRRRPRSAGRERRSCGPPAQTVNRYRDLLSAALDYAVGKGWIEENALKGQPRRGRKAERQRILRRDDFALGLRWGAVDFEAEVVRVYDNFVENQLDTTKTEATVAIPMTPRWRAALWKLKQCGYRTADEDFVHTRDVRGAPASAASLRRAFRKAQVAAGLKAIPMYNARHSFGMALARSGRFDVRTIQAL